MTEGTRSNPLVTVMILCIVVAVFLGLFMTIWAIDVRLDTLQGEFRIASQEREAYAQEIRNQHAVVRAEIHRMCVGDEEENDAESAPSTPTGAATP